MTGSDQLRAILTPSDRLTVRDGRLAVACHDAAGLLRQHGSPLYVAIEDTIRVNYRRIRDAFAACWQAPVVVMFAVKANNTLAIRAVLSQEGAGGDCFGLGEVHACLTGGTDPERMVMNGSNKTPDEITAAIGHDIRINIDSEAEIEMIEALALTGRPVRVNLRLKPLPPGIDAFGAAFFKSTGGMLDAVRRTKWGFSCAEASRLVRRILASSRLNLEGYSCHVGRFSNEPGAFAIVAEEFGRDIVRLFDETGFWPAMLDLGGGWPRQREPESREPAMNPHAIEAYAASACAALQAGLAPAGQKLPSLWLEPGRYLVGNAVVLLAEIGAIKRDLGHVWMHVDASTNNLMRVETSGAWHHILPATRMDAPMTQLVDVVGGTCIPSVLGAQREMPELARGDAVAVLDAGMYAEVLANEFNSVGRPATVMVSASGVHVVRRRGTVADVFASHQVPVHLRPRVDAGEASTA